MMTTSTSTASRVVSFAAEVRSALADLPDDEVDELTEGLEADLSEQAEDANSPRDAFGDPIAYADELRAAAGLPSRRSPAAVHRSRSSARDRVTTSTATLVRGYRESRFGAESVEIIVALRPAWWVLRGWALYVLLDLLFSGGYPEVIPASAPAWVALIALVVVSTQWGRGKWLPSPWRRAVQSTIGVVAAISLMFLLPISLNAAASATSQAFDDAATDYGTSGLSSNGMPIGNVFAYDENGLLLSDVQLFDQDGHPLDLIGASEGPQGSYTAYDVDGNEMTVVPSDDVPGRTGWNVYPLRQAVSSDIDYEVPGGAVDDGDTRVAEPPFAEVQPLAQRLTTQRPINQRASTDPAQSTPTPSTPTPTPTPSPSPELPRGQ